MTNTYCCVYSVETPDNGHETRRVDYQNKVERKCILLASIIRIYHDARPSECQIITYVYSSPVSVCYECVVKLNIKIEYNSDLFHVC